MIVYVESNFVLQLALEQEERTAAETIFEYGLQDKIKLIVPAFALSEPFSTLAYRSNDWGRIGQSLSGQVQTQLARSQSRHQIVKAISELITGLTAISQEDNYRLQAIIQHLIQFAGIIPLNIDIFRDALAYSARYNLSLQDAIIYASIVSDLQSRGQDEEKCFVSANSKDFNNAGIKGELAAHSCRYIARFEQALSYIDSRVV
ncbi:MAG: PIN domain-containing protein [Chloroflexia bacterium]